MQAKMLRLLPRRWAMKRQASRFMRKVSRRRIVQTVVELLRQRPERRHIVLMLAAYLIAHKQQKQLDLILLDLAHELQAREGHMYAEVVNAFPLDASSIAELEQYLKRTTGATSIELDERVDAELLAGMIVRTADLELDTSARSKLSRLRSLHVKTPEKA